MQKGCKLREANKFLKICPTNYNGGGNLSERVVDFIS